jgi:Zn-dependent peptidase ImmA (M78 family)/transcriptional regulator with XRE-family HTH domain
MAERTARLDVNPAVLKWARESVGLGIEAVAVSLGQTSRTIERWETGEEKPTANAIRRLASFYERPVAALLLSKPRTEKLPTDFRVVAASEPLTRESLVALRRAAHIQKVVANLTGQEVADFGFVNRVALTNDTAEDLAGRERERLGISINDQGSWRGEYQALRQWRSAVEESGVIVLQFPMPVEEIRGFALAGQPAVICLNMSDLATARTFTLLHEYAHLLAGSGGICDSDAGPRSSRSRVRVERFCNRFAGALLVPSGALLQHRDLITPLTGPEPPRGHLFSPLIGHFRVSRQVIWYRLRQLKLIDEELFDSKWSQWASRLRKPISGPSDGGGMTRIDRAVHENGHRFVALILEAEHKGQVSTPDALDLLRVRVSELEDVASAIGK